MKSILNKLFKAKPKTQVKEQFLDFTIDDRVITRHVITHDGEVDVSDPSYIHKNKAILFMLNDLRDNSLVSRSKYAVIGSCLLSPEGVDMGNGIATILNHDYFETFKHNARDMMKYRPTEYENTPILIQTTDISSLSFTLREELKCAIYIGRWFVDDYSREYVLSVLELKPYMDEVDKEIRIEHNLSRLTLGNKFDQALINQVSNGHFNRYLDDLLTLRKSIITAGSSKLFEQYNHLFINHYTRVNMV